MTRWRWPQIGVLLVAILGLAVVGQAAPTAARTLERGATASSSRQAPAGDPRDAQGDPALMPDVWAGFDGQAKPGRWLTVRAVVANDGPPIVGQMRLSMRSDGETVVYAQPVDLPTRGRKLLTFETPGPATASSGITLSLWADDDVLVTRTVPLRFVNPTDFLVGVLADDGVAPPGLGAVKRGGNPIALAMLTIADLPSEPQVLQALDALIVRQASSDRMTPEQRAALRTWVEHGGQLVVAGGPGWRRSVAGLEDLLPLEGVQTRETTHLRALTHYAGAAPPDGDVLVAFGTPVAGARVLLAQDGVPLLTERWVGLGRVTFVGPDPALAPFRSWPGSEALWQRVVVGGRPGLPTLEVGPSGGSTIDGALRSLLNLRLPASGWIVLFLLGYVVVVGPVQYAVLRRWDRREWAWIGFPVLALGGVGLLLGVSALLRGPDVRLAAITMTRLHEDAVTVPQDTFLALAAPARGAYDLALLNGAVPRPLPSTSSRGSSPTVLELGGPGSPTMLPQLRLEGRAPRGFLIRSADATPAPVLADLRATAERIQGTVKNVGPDHLEDVVVVAGGEAVAVGDLPPGESRPVTVTLQTSRAGGPWQMGPSPWAAINPRMSSGEEYRRGLLAQILQPSRGSDGEASGGVVLYAWGAAPLPRMTLGGDSDGSGGGAALTGESQRLLVQALPVVYGERTVSIPPGLLSRTLLDGSVQGRGGTSFIARGPAVFQFDLPAGLEFATLDDLRVYVAPPQTGNPNAPLPRISLYRWADRTWMDVPPSSTGVTAMASGEAFVDGGAIRVRVEPRGTDVQVDQLDLSLAGVRR